MTATRNVPTSGQGSLRVLGFLVVIAAFWPLVILSSRQSAVPDDVRLESAVLWILCWLPTVVYVATKPSRRPPIPFFPIIGVAHGLYYALQLTVGVDNANQVWMITLDPLDPRRDYEHPMEMALLGWVCLLVSYYATTAMARPKPLSLPAGLRTSAVAIWATRFLAGGVLLEGIRQTISLPGILSGFLHLATMLSHIGLALLIVLQVRGQLLGGYKIVLYAGLVSLILLAIGTGSIANGIFVSLSALLAMWVGRQRVRTRWIVIGLFGAAVFISLRGVAYDYRRIAWFTNEQLPVTQRSQLLLGMLAARVQSDGIAGTVLHGWEAVSTRSANLDLFADVVRRTPRQVPYWNGQTYMSLVGAAVPRILWPNKPTKQLGQAFGHRYGYLGENDRSTSINLPYFVEFYCNFGELGVVLGMLLVGWLYAKLEQRLNSVGQSTLVSVCGIVLLVPLLNIESDFSLIFGGLLLNGVALWAVLRVVARASLDTSRARQRTRDGRVPGTARA
jgi:hypothetical protein